MALVVRNKSGNDFQSKFHKEVDPKYELNASQNRIHGNSNGKVLWCGCSKSQIENTDGSDKGGWISVYRNLAIHLFEIRMANYILMGNNNTESISRARNYHSNSTDSREIHLPAQTGISCWWQREVICTVGQLHKIHKWGHLQLISSRMKSLMPRFSRKTPDKAVVLKKKEISTLISAWKVGKWR